MKKFCSLVPLLLLLPSVCWGWLGLRNRSYIQMGIKMTWNEAQSFCRKDFTDMVTVRDQKDNQHTSTGKGWLGLYRDNSSSPWKWTGEEEIANFTTWELDEPKLDGDCASSYYYESKWRSFPCHDTRRFMCYDEKLLLVKEKKSWEEALKHCRALGAADPHYRYDLATLLTPDDLDFARGKAGGATTAEVWTGLRYLAGNWLWVGGEPVAENSDPVCLTENILTSCGALETRGNNPIVGLNCKDRKNFFCYKVKVGDELLPCKEAQTMPCFI